jgi:rhodanese-related sulfurtransferase
VPGRRALALAALGLAGLLLAGLALGLQARGPVALRPLVSLWHPDVEWISTGDLAERLQEAAEGRAQAPLLLDARSEAEVTVSALPGAIRVPEDGSGLEDVPGARAVVVYCSIGWRSARVAGALRTRGHRDVRNLEGGLFAWANEGRRVERGGVAVWEVHPYDALWGALLAPELRATRPR